MTFNLFCIASGPSLTKEDCQKVIDANIKIVAVNESWRMVPNCDFVYAGDYKYWHAFHKELESIKAEKWTCARGASIRWGVNLHIANGPFNSGMRAIQWGIEYGFKCIGLLGYDCSVKNGIHWHGEHTAKGLKNPNSGKVNKWHNQFRKVSLLAKQNNVSVINCSRFTELGYFPIAKLRNVL